MTSELLCNAIGNKLAPYIGEEGCIRLIQCFLNPQLMLCHPEPPKPLSEMVPGAKPRHTVDREEKKIDHLYQFFTRNEHQQIGEDFGRCQVYNRLLTAATFSRNLYTILMFTYVGTSSLLCPFLSLPRAIRH